MLSEYKSKLLFITIREALHMWLSTNILQIYILKLQRHLVTQHCVLSRQYRTCIDTPAQDTRHASQTTPLRERREIRDYSARRK